MTFSEPSLVRRALDSAREGAWEGDSYLVSSEARYKCPGLPWIVLGCPELLFLIGVLLGLGNIVQLRTSLAPYKTPLYSA